MPRIFREWKRSLLFRCVRANHGRVAYLWLFSSEFKTSLSRSSSRIISSPAFDFIKSFLRLFEYRLVRHVDVRRKAFSFFELSSMPSVLSAEFPLSTSRHASLVRLANRFDLTTTYFRDLRFKQPYVVTALNVNEFHPLFYIGRKSTSIVLTKISSDISDTYIVRVSYSPKQNNIKSIFARKSV